MSHKPTLMILGTHHLDNPKSDMVNFDADDILTPKRQHEIRELVALLSNFRPTKIAVEVIPEQELALEQQYQHYMTDDVIGARHEVRQLGFRLAKQMGHDKVHAVDWCGTPPVDEQSMDFGTFAQEHGQDALLKEAAANVHAIMTEFQEIQTNGSLLDLYRFQNEPTTLHALHVPYLLITRIGANTHYPGAEWVQYWYGRNLKIFANITRITTSSEERILLIIGLGHVWLLQQFAHDSGLYTLENPRHYLGAPHT